MGNIRGSKEAIGRDEVTVVLRESITTKFNNSYKKLSDRY